MNTALHAILPAADLARLEIEASAPINPAVAYLESLGSSVSKRTMVSPLNRVAAIVNPSGIVGKDAWTLIPWQRLTAPVVRAVMAKLDGAPSTRNKALAALKGVAQAAWEMRLLDTDELTRIRNIKGDAGSREVAGRYVPPGEISALLRLCAEDRTAAGARDAAMIALAALTGARRAEIASIRLDDVQQPESRRFDIRIIGKRNKERILYVTGNAALALTDWLTVRVTSNCNSCPLFCAIRKGGMILPERPLSTTALDKILRKRSAEAGVTDLDWHDLRRTTASNLLDAGEDIATVASILGHSNIQTTARYDRRGERARIKAAESLSVPYFARKAA